MYPGSVAESYKRIDLLSAIRGWHIAYQSMFHTLCYVEIKFCVDCSSSHAFYVLSGQLSGPQFV
jgi:hypothetical protein